MMFLALVVDFICDVLDGKAEYCYVVVIGFFWMMW